MNVVLQIDRTDLAAWPIAPGALLIAGRTRHPVPDAGVAALERRRSDRGPYRALSWTLDHDGGGDNEGGIAFVAAVRLPAATLPAPGQALTLEDARGGATALRLPATLGNAQDFAAKAVQLAAASARVGANLARFLFATFPPSATQRMPVIGTMLAAVLAGLATDDGCIELMGAIPGACGFLQGWGGPVPPDAHANDGGMEALLVGGRTARARVRVATFARPDIVTPASGMVLVVDDHATGQVPLTDTLAVFPSLEHVYLLTDTAVLRRASVERRLLSPADSVGHIRDMLPALTCPPAAADCLRLALRPRYEGRETLGEQALPVRAAVDQALLLPADGARPANIYLGGWLFDPTGVVTQVTIRDSAGMAARLDASWTRIPRDDVSKALTAAGFPPPAQDEHGFAACVEGGFTASGGLYLDISFRDGTCAFLPVAAASAHDVAARARVLDGTDLHKPSGTAVVERQLGPLFYALMQREPARPGRPAPLPATVGLTVAVIVPLVGAARLPRSVFSQFLRDPLAADETLVLVCGSAWDDGALAGLQRTASFMGLPAKILRAPEATDATSALDIAADCVAAPYYLLLDPGTAGCRPGWRRALRAAAEAEAGPAVVCPTLIYEDLSIRYAGAAPIVAQPSAPYVTVPRPLAGMPVALAEDGPPRPTALGSLACCLVPRAALLTLGGAQTRLATDFGQENAFFLRLQAAGLPCLWVPRAQIFAPDTAIDGRIAAPQGAAVGRLVDGWCLRAGLQAGLFAPKAGIPPLPKRAEG